MKVTGVVVALVLVGGCGSKSEQKPMEAPSLSGAGDVKVPPGHETTYTFGKTPTKLEWTWLEIVDFAGKPAIRLLAQGGPKHGMLTLLAEIPPATPTLASMAGSSVGAVPKGVSFGNAPEMATGTGATIKIVEVTPTYMAGTFEAQACPHGKSQCDRPTSITNGTFKAFRSALSDDAAFVRYVKPAAAGSAAQ